MIAETKGKGGYSLLKNNFARKNDDFIGYKNNQKSGNHFYYGQVGTIGTLNLNHNTGTNVTSKASTIPNRTVTKMIKSKNENKLLTNPSIQSIEETIHKNDSQLGVYDALVVENVSKYKHGNVSFNDIVNAQQRR